jgi:pyruvate dehydrogenase E2 component (dihydrolipoamide acetyltransferase)
MPIELTMPRLSDTMEAGTVIKWNVKEGDTVQLRCRSLADIETDKATMEMPCFDDGTHRRASGRAGQAGEGRHADRDARASTARIVAR